MTGAVAANLWHPLASTAVPRAVAASLHTQACTTYLPLLLPQCLEQRPLVCAPKVTAPIAAAVALGAEAIGLVALGCRTVASVLLCCCVLIWHAQAHSSCQLSLLPSSEQLLASTVGLSGLSLVLSPLVLR